MLHPYKAEALSTAETFSGKRRPDWEPDPVNLRRNKGAPMTDMQPDCEPGGSLNHPTP